MIDPIKRPKSDFHEILDVINLADSPVGIDPQYTHAIIISYLQQLHQRLDRLEAALNRESPRQES